MKYLLGKKSFTGLVLLLVAVSAFAADEKYLGVPLAEGGLQTSNTADHYGVPFLQGLLPLESGGAIQVNVGGTVERIFLLGMTDQISEETRVGRSRHGPSELIRPAVPLDAWADPRDQSTRFWVGDKLGEIRLDYADGSTQIFLWSSVKALVGTDLSTITPNLIARMRICARPGQKRAPLSARTGEPMEITSPSSIPRRIPIKDIVF